MFQKIKFFRTILIKYTKTKKKNILKRRFAIKINRTTKCIIQGAGGRGALK